MNNTTSGIDILGLLGNTKPTIVKSTRSVEKISEAPNKRTVFEYQVEFSDIRALWHQEPNGEQVPFQAKYIGFNTAVFNSRVHETFGELTTGTSIFIYGLDMERDGSGNFLKDTIPNPAFVEGGTEPETIEIPKLITHNADGSEIDMFAKPKLTFRPHWGTDQSKQSYTRLRNADMLNLVPNLGVPRKNATVVTESDATEGTLDQATAKRRTDSIAWNLLPGLQSQMEKPLLHANVTTQLAGKLLEMNLADVNDPLRVQIVTEMGLNPKATDEEIMDLHNEMKALKEQFIDKIPVSTSAPSQKAAAATGGFTPPAGTTNTITNAASALPKDAFGGAPEDRD